MNTIFIEDLLKEEIKQLKIAVDSIEDEHSILKKDWSLELSHAVILRMILADTGLTVNDVVFLYNIIQHSMED